MRTIVVGSRQSSLALTQTGQVIEQLQQLCRENGLDWQFKVHKIVTKGDRILDVTLSKVGGKGLFVKEIEQALLDGVIDIAVHSMKDVPSERQQGLILGAIPKRVDPRDCIISNGHVKLDELPEGALIGTSSLRRAAQIKAYRPDLRIESIRGNIDSRIRKLTSEGFDAIVLAAAGLQRMGWLDRVSQFLPPELCLPAVGQGALGVECRESDAELVKLLAHYNDLESAETVQAERSFLARLNGGCQVPIAAYAEKFREPVSQSSSIRLTGLVGEPGGSVILQETMTGDDPQQLGRKLADELAARGAEEILAKVREAL
ncbi:hydroxymethylbilane synthase [Paenibacillus senegalensis]|uniref:hydroxymethylbilane synthase n=1 Tax=Paenibacillus senegalensis TaxID=1465766 RepID=UPI000289F362|nr:hydroxymethylbilane synthase [Paenibacillus senegalensis]